MIPSCIMRLAHTHRVMREVDIAVITYNESQRLAEVDKVVR